MAEAQKPAEKPRLISEADITKYKVWAKLAFDTTLIMMTGPPRRLATSLTML